MPPHEKVVEGGVHLYGIPAELTHDNSVAIAIRVWHWPRWAIPFPGGMLVPPRIGDTEFLKAEVNNGNNETFWNLTHTNILLLINLLAGLSALALFALRPAEREYLWFGASEMLTAIDCSLSDFQHYYSHSVRALDVLSNCAQSLSSLFFLAFVFTLLKGSRNWLYWSGFVALGLQLLLVMPGETGWISLATWYLVGGLLSVPFYASVLALLYGGARRGITDARLLLLSVALFYAVESLRVLAFTINALGRRDLLPYLLWLFPSFEWPFPFSIRNVFDLLMQLSILAILLMRFARTRRDEERLSAELESARAVQQVLIPSEIPGVRGFAVASVYKPATQVGGDFFQIIPTASGGLLVVIGDVSGKGMPAAMTVSLLVGTVRTLAHYTQNPGEILAAMNQRMLARSAGGFTTCLVLRAEPNGILTVANAGHIAPYLCGEELHLENGLPLRLAADSTYMEFTSHLEEGEQLTLMTDGIVEARSTSGELFGFERTRGVATKSAESIAQAAQDFGQEDDITVLTISRLGVGEESITLVTTSALSPSPS